MAGRPSAPKQLLAQPRADRASLALLACLAIALSSFAAAIVPGLGTSSIPFLTPDIADAAQTGAGAGADPAPKPAPKTSLPVMEDQVMCPICGELLTLSQSPAAMRERAFIRKLIARGKSEDQIKDALVAEYGPQVLAEPEGSGFNVTAYLVPILGFAIAVVALAFAVFRWRRGRSGDGDDESAERPLSGSDDERIDEDIARYDL